MLRSYLIENRICYDGDGGSNGGSAADDARQTATPAQTDARGRPLVRGTTNVIDASRQILPPEDNEPNIPPPAPTRQPFVPSPEINPPPPSTFVGARGNAVSGGPADPAAGARVANMVANLVNPPVAAPATVSPAPPPVNDSAEMARQLIENAANESIASGIDREILDSVDRPAGRRDAGSGFFADAYDELYGGTAPGTGFGQMPLAQILGGLTNAPDPADAAAFNVGQLEALGGVRDPQTGAITGARAGPGTLNMNRLGMVTYSGLPDPNYTGAFQNLVRGNTGTMSSEDTDDGGQMAQQMAPAPVDPGTTTPEQIDDLAINYLRNPFYLYSGANNLFQPYGYAGGTLVDLLQTRNMTMPDQAAPNLNLFGNPRDFA